MKRCPSCDGDIREQCEHSCSSCLGYGIRMNGLGSGAIGVCPVCFGTQLEPYWTDGERSIYNADCRVILPLVQATVDLVLTDPPYSEGTHSMHAAGMAWGDLVAPRSSDRARLSFTHTTLADLSGVLTATTAQRWAVFTIDETLAAELRVSPPKGWRYVRTGIWIKPGGAPQFTGDRPGMGYEPVAILHRSGNGRSKWNGGGSHALWTFPAYHGGHPTEKPLALYRRFTELFSNPGDIILDPFLGSGTTLRAAKDLGRRGLGIELEEKYCKIAAGRMAQAALPLAEPERATQEALL